MAQRDATGALVLLEFESSYGLGFVAGGRIVTCLHVVQGEAEIDAHLADGRTLKVSGISAIDVQKNLVVLDVGLLDITSARLSSERFVDEGVAVEVFGMLSGESRARWVEGRLGPVQPMGEGFSLYRLDGNLPRDASGGPIVAEDGSIVGVVMATQSDEGVELVGLPWRYVAPLLLQNRDLPLSLINRRLPQREVAHHSIALLEGSAVEGLQATALAVSRAIRRGAPAYNEGSIGRCLRVYRAAARAVIDEREDCPGVQAILRAGLMKADATPDQDLQAWALRDSFDGLLSVIDRYLAARAGGMGSPEGGRTGYMN